MNSFHFVPALVTLSPTLTTQREQIASNMEIDGPPGGCYHNFCKLIFLGYALASYNMKIEPEFINEDIVLYKTDVRVFNPRLNSSKS